MHWYNCLVFTENAVTTTANLNLHFGAFVVAVLIRNFDEWTVYLREKINELKIYDHICDPLSSNASALDTKVGSIWTMSPRADFGLRGKSTWISKIVNNLFNLLLY